MKKILALLIALAMILALAACGGGSSATPASNTPAATEPAEADLDDSWFTAPKGTVASRTIAHHESSFEFFGEKYEDIYDEVVAYDADENQLYVRWIDAEGKKSENTFEYDAEGNLILWTARSEEDGEYWRQVSEYENGLCVKTVETDSQGEEVVTTYEYNGKGWPVKDTVTGGDFPGVTERKYNENHDVVLEVNYNSDGSEIAYKYDYDGLLLMKQTRDATYADGTTDHEETVWEYDANGNCIKMVEHDSDMDLIYEYEYDENNNKIKETYTGYDSYTATTEYDADGNNTHVLIEYAEGGTEDETFEYDSQGRVIRDYELMKNGDSESYYSITYKYE